MKRNTWQREAVREALASRTEFVSAQGLHAVLRERGSTIGLATVYRALADLAETELADSLQSPEGEVLYRACVSESHHHHLVCRACGLTIEVQAAAVEEWAHATAEDNGFTDVVHVADVFGSCAACA